jgi:hypothetical protein
MVEFDHVRPPESFNTSDEAQAYYQAVRAEAEARRAAAREREQQLNENLLGMFAPLLEDILADAGVGTIDVDSAAGDQL